MIETAQIISGEAGICPFHAQLMLGHMVLALGSAPFYARAEPGIGELWIAGNLELMPAPDPMPIHVFSDQDMQRSDVRKLTENRRIERVGCRGGLGLNFVY